jgi:hypothetical protein
MGVDGQLARLRRSIPTCVFLGRLRHLAGVFFFQAKIERSRLRYKPPTNVTV